MIDSLKVLRNDKPDSDIFPNFKPIRNPEIISEALSFLVDGSCVAPDEQKFTGLY